MNVKVKIPEAEEEFKYIKKLILKYKWYVENNYKIALPQHPYIYEAVSRNGIDVDWDALKFTFEEGIYNFENYELGAMILESKVLEIIKISKVLEVFHKNWGFKFFNGYTIRLTLYGPGGSYDQKNGTIVMRTDNDKFKKNNPCRTAIHEIIHIGIEEIIVQKYKLSQNIKERIVDLICSYYIPDYECQARGDKSIDQFMSKEIVVNDLPRAVESFVKTRLTF